MNHSYRIIVDELSQMEADWGHVWKTPPLIDSLKFAACEVAEAIDAELRMNGDYFRNRDFAQTRDEYYAEICDAIMMLCKALMSVEYPFDFERDPIVSSIKKSLYRVGSGIYILLFNEERINYSQIEDLLIDLANSVDTELGEGYVARVITEKLVRTREKIIERIAEKAGKDVE